MPSSGRNSGISNRCFDPPHTMSTPANTGTILVPNMTNQEFLEFHALPGRVGLSGGFAPIDRAIQRAERHLTADGSWGIWTHAFIFQGRRHDGHHWVVESNLGVHRKHIRLGAQENRIANFFDQSAYPYLAVLDFGLPEPHTQRLLAEALELVASRARYSIHELLGTLVALHRDASQRGDNNILSKDRSFYCSAFVHHLFQKIGIELAPGIHSKLTTPEDISRTATPHTTYLLQRDLVRSPLEKIATRVRGRIGTRIKSLKPK